MVAWKHSFWGRFVHSLRLLWRTSLVQLVLALFVVPMMALLLALMVATTKYAMEWMSVTLIVTGVGMLLLTWFPVSVVLSALVQATAGEGQVAQRSAWSGAWRRLPLLANTSFLLALCAVPLVLAAGLAAALSPLVVLLLIPIMVWLGLRLYTLPAVLMMEDRNPWQALQRAWQLSAGFCWRVLGNGVLLGLLLLLVWLALFVLMLLVATGGFAGVMGLLGSGGFLSSMMGMAAIAGTGVVSVLALVMVMMAFAMLFYAEQRQAVGEGVVSWQAGPSVPRLQWLIFWVVLVLPSLGEVSGLVDVPGFSLSVSDQQTTKRSVTHHAAKPIVQQKKRPPVRTPSLGEQKVALYQKMQGGGDMVQLQRQLDRLLRQHPDDAWLMQAQGWVLYRRGDKQQAVVLMAKACQAGVPAACLLAKGVE